MSQAQIIDGKKIAAKLKEQVALDVKNLKATRGVTPGLAVIIVGKDPASSIYVKNKRNQTIECGMESFDYNLPQESSEEELLEKIAELNKNDKVHGILVQLPLPEHIDEKNVLAAINPVKDVDGFHVINAGKLATGQTDGLIPCTPSGCMVMLKETLGDLTGLNAVIVGRSNIVGKPMAHLLLNANCTVTITHSKTKNLKSICQTADILVAAIGKPEFIKADWIKKGATIIDVGINRITDKNGKNKIVGDIEFSAALEKAAHITPVPGGVGPMTIACLLKNTYEATLHQI